MEPDEIIHQTMRLKIMSALGSSGDSPLAFVRLKEIVKTTDGNLGAHISTLEKAGYVAVEKDFHGKKPRTRVSVTKEGRRAFARHVAYLRDVLESANVKDAGAGVETP